MRTLKPRYCVPITRREALDFMQLHFGTARLPRRASFVWVAGVHYVSDQAGVYLVSAAGGSCGVQVIEEAA